MQEQQYHLRELQNPVVLAEARNENVIANGQVVGTDSSRCQDAENRDMTTRIAGCGSNELLHAIQCTNAFCLVRDS